MEPEKSKQSKQWEVVQHTGLLLRKDQRIAVHNGEIVVEQMAADRDVTEECRVELVKSKHSSGYYVGIFHGSKCIVALGVDELSSYQLRSNGYRLEKAPEATVSFRVMTSRRPR